MPDPLQPKASGKTASIAICSMKLNFEGGHNNKETRKSSHINHVIVVI